MIPKPIGNEKGNSIRISARGLNKELLDQDSNLEPSG